MSMTVLGSVVCISPDMSEVMQAVRMWQATRNLT